MLNNPINASDPSGHKCVGEVDECKDGDGKQINGSARHTKRSPIVDADWSDKKPEDRARTVWNAICQSGGWWGTGCPGEQELASWLLYEEGGPLLSPDYEENMARGIRYRFANFGNTPDSFVLQLSGFTAFYNPNSGSSFDQKDWNELTGPDFNFDKEKRIIEDVYKSVMKPGDGKYMYWWDEGEVKNSRGKWPGTKDIHYFQTTTIRGVPFYFTGIPNIQRCAMGMNNAACK